MDLPDALRPYLLLIVPILIIQLVLLIAALWDLVNRPKTRGPKWAWLLVILLVNIIGPIIYFVIGREEE
jgi:hypothetical protein